MRAILRVCATSVALLFAAPSAAQGPGSPPADDEESADRVEPSSGDDAISEEPRTDAPTAEATPPTDTPTTDAPPELPPAAVEEPAQAEPEREPTVQLQWGEGLRVRSDDGLFTLEIRSRVQAQAAFESAGPGETDPNIEFLIRRARLTFRGNLGDPSIQYYVQLSFAPRDMEPDLLIPLRDAQIAWLAHRDLSLRVGQMKVPFNRERVISSSALQFVDRSIVNAELNLDRDIGVQLYSNDLFGLGDILSYQLGVFGGEGRLRLNEGTGLLYVARLEVQPLGEFDDDYSMADLERDDRPRLSIGAGFAWNQESQRNRSTLGSFYQLGGFDYASFEADLMFKIAGFSLMAEVIWREATGVRERTGEVDGVTVTETARNGIGWLVQAGYLFSREVPIELAARFADIQPLGVSDMRPEREMTLGVSYYAIGHDLKVQLDYSYLHFERFEDGIHRVRLQTQAFF